MYFVNSFYKICTNNDNNNIESNNIYFIWCNPFPTEQKRMNDELSVTNEHGYNDYDPSSMVYRRLFLFVCFSYVNPSILWDKGVGG